MPKRKEINEERQKQGRMKTWSGQREHVRNTDPFIATVPSLSRYIYQPWTSIICRALKQLILALQTTKCMLIRDIIKL